MKELFKATITSAGYSVGGSNPHFILKMEWPSYTDWESATLLFAPHLSLSPEQLQIIENFCGEKPMKGSKVQIVTEDQCIIGIGHEKENQYLSLIKGSSNDLVCLSNFAPVYERLQ